MTASFKNEKKSWVSRMRCVSIHIPRYLGRLLIGGVGIFDEVSKGSRTSR